MHVIVFRGSVAEAGAYPSVDSTSQRMRERVDEFVRPASCTIIEVGLSLRKCNFLHNERRLPGEFSFVMAIVHITDLDMNPEEKRMKKI